MTNFSTKAVVRCSLAMMIVLCVGLTSFAEQDKVDQLAGRLEKHVIALSKDFHPRDQRNLENQAKCVKYIGEHFKKAGGKVTTQDVEFRGQTYQNVIARFGNQGGKRFVVGAHYDSPSGSPGADDNASGVAGLNF